MSSRLVAITALAVGLAIAFASPPVIAAVALALPLIALVVGPNVELDRVAQAALTIGAMVVGVLVTRLGYGEVPPDPGTLSDRTLLLGMPMLAVASARALVVRPVYGARLTLAAALVALTAAGRSQAGLSYPCFAALAVGTAFAAARHADPHRAPLRALATKHWAGVAFAVASTFGFAAGASVVLPELRDALVARMMARWERDRTGFSDAMWLGAMNRMLQSDAVVLRLRGSAPELLRGGILTSYAGGRWETPLDVPVDEVVETPAQPTDPAGYVEIEHAGRPERYFLPSDAHDVVVSGGIYARDSLGLARPSGGITSKRVWYRGGGTPSLLAPRLSDLHVPTKIAPQLAATIGSWGVDGLPPHEAMRALEARLSTDYRYSTAFSRDADLDPVVDFLTLHREGHCEYFASALALLGRSARVPTRVVVGYRVVEQSPLGYRIVRERNAHSWVEAWIDGRWETFDATPAADLALASRPETPVLGALSDALATGWEAVDDWLGRRTPFEFSLALVTLFGVLLLYRALRGGTKAAAALRFDPPLPAFLDLSAALSSLGVDRAPDETIRSLLSRVARSDELATEAKVATTLALERYELLRYAAEGDASEVSRALGEAAALLRAARAIRASSAPPASPPEPSA